MAKKKVIGRPFEKGNPGGPGRPKAAKEREYLEAFRTTVPIDQWIKCVSQQLKKALKGDGTAFDRLAKYCLPQPAMMVDLGKGTVEAFRAAGMNDDELKEKMAREVIETFKKQGTA